VEKNDLHNNDKYEQKETLLSQPRPQSGLNTPWLLQAKVMKEVRIECLRTPYIASPNPLASMARTHPCVHADVARLHEWVLADVTHPRGCMVKWARLHGRARVRTDAWARPCGRADLPTR
jgi:hypothetical protein